MPHVGVDSRSAAARHREEVIVVHYGCREHRVRVVDSVWQMYPVSSEVTDLEDRLPGKLMLNVNVPLLNIAARRIKLDQAISQVVAIEKWIGTIRERSGRQFGDAALLILIPSKR